ncbi:hypothetical protein JOB18_037767 [Solea senegalensis]|uniref:Uncharacterized protein n=1 Tax=Solea senegalensis TaxID=28829 RepID=A0AAV6R8P4_SOLSE|nr:hypothetical protein JOB18_037767 [Solea senegalensis]
MPKSKKEQTLEESDTFLTLERFAVVAFADAVTVNRGAVTKYSFNKYEKKNSNDKRFSESMSFICCTKQSRHFFLSCFFWNHKYFDTFFTMLAFRARLFFACEGRVKDIRGRSDALTCFSSVTAQHYSRFQLAESQD